MWGGSVPALGFLCLSAGSEGEFVRGRRRNHQRGWSPPAPPVKLKVVVAEGSVAPDSWSSKPLTLIARRQVVTCEFGVLVDGPDRDPDGPAAAIPTLVVRWLNGGETPAELEKIKAAYEHPPGLRVGLVAAHPFRDSDFTWFVPA